MAVLKDPVLNRPNITEEDINRVIKLLMYREWEREWQAWPEAKQTKLFYPTLRPDHSFEVVNSTRRFYSTLIQLETGHNFMARHQHLIDKANGIQGTSQTCKLCGTGEQTSAHILAQCHELIPLREKYFKKPFLNPPYINLESRAVLGYLREAPIEELHFFITEGE